MQVLELQRRVQGTQYASHLQVSQANWQASLCSSLQNACFCSHSRLLKLATGCSDAV